MISLEDTRSLYVKTKLISFINNYYRIYNEHHQLIAFSKMKGFKLKEDIRIYSDESMSHELFRIQTNQIIDFSASYFITDSQTGEALGSLRRSGFKSMARDHWTISDPAGELLYEMKEDSLLLALIRRTLCRLVPASYHLYKDDSPTGVCFSQNFNPFILHFKADLNYWDKTVDKRLAVAAIILLLSIEGKQN